MNLTGKTVLVTVKLDKLFLYGPFSKFSIIFHVNNGVPPELTWAPAGHRKLAAVPKI